MQITPNGAVIAVVCWNCRRWSSNWMSHLTAKNKSNHGSLHHQQGTNHRDTTQKSKLKEEKAKEETAFEDACAYFCGLFLFYLSLLQSSPHVCISFHSLTSLYIRTWETWKTCCRVSIYCKPESKNKRSFLYALSKVVHI